MGEVDMFIKKNTLEEDGTKPLQSQESTVFRKGKWSRPVREPAAGSSFKRRDVIPAFGVVGFHPGWFHADHRIWKALWRGEHPMGFCQTCLLAPHLWDLLLCQAIWDFRKDGIYNVEVGIAQCISSPIGPRQLLIKRTVLMIEERKGLKLVDNASVEMEKRKRHGWQWNFRGLLSNRQAWTMSWWDELDRTSKRQILGMLEQRTSQGKNRDLSCIRYACDRAGNCRCRWEPCIVNRWKDYGFSSFLYGGILGVARFLSSEQNR